MKTIEQRLSRIDLNLLVTFSVIYKEKSVSRAAQTLYLSQPAVSRALARLRELFDDELFLRKHDGLIANAKAHQIYRSLPNLLTQLDKLTRIEEFNPLTTKANVTVAAPVLIAQPLFSSLSVRLSKLAPNMVIHDRHLSDDTFEKLALGTIDFCLLIDRHVDDDIIKTYIGETAPAIFCRRGHPILEAQNFSLEDLNRYNFINLKFIDNLNQQFSVPIDQYLNAKGIKRNIKVSTQQMSTALEIVNNTDYLLATAKLINNLSLANTQLHCLFDTEEENTIKKIFLYEAKRSLTNPVHRWVKQQIVEILKQFLN